MWVLVEWVGGELVGFVVVIDIFVL